MRYVVDVLKQMPDSANYNAWSKAPADVIRTLKDSGAKLKIITVPDIKIKLISKIVGIVYTFFASLSFQSGDELYIQRYGYYINFLVHRLKKKNIKINYLIHDLTFFRMGKDAGGLEFSLLKQADVLFVHTEAMAQLLKGYGLNQTMKIMHLFDYYSEDSMVPIMEMKKMRNVIAFAGNLNKSIFLKSLCESSIPSDFKYSLFGLKNDTDLFNNTQVTYAGAFLPSKTGVLRAGWGLLWDGDSLNTCSGLMGEYLRYNSSHKISLYLSCGIPVILWRKSSLAEWLSEKGACVLIDSIDDVYSAIRQISDSQYSQMVENARVLGDMLRQGSLLKELL